MIGENPVRPAYGRAGLTDILPAVASHLGVPGYADLLGLPDASRYVVLLVDGLGAEQLAAYASSAPTLALAASRTLTCGVPSTTATSLTSLATGQPPGVHGTAGYTFRNPVDRTCLNALTWAPGLDPLALQPIPTVFERAAEAGVRVTKVLPARFRDSGLTVSGLRGGRFAGISEDGSDERSALVVAAATAGDRTFVYCYERHLDHTGHAEGVGSGAWLRRLVLVERFVTRLRRELPADVVLVVTADHGMVNVPAHHRVVIEDEPVLSEGIDLIAGEGRFRQLYSGQPDAVATRWADRLGDRAWVLTRAEAASAKWFGDLDDRVADRFGDVLVAMRSDWATLTYMQSGELGLVGMHGSLTSAEMNIPLAVLA